MANSICIIRLLYQGPIYVVNIVPVVVDMVRIAVVVGIEISRDLIAKECPLSPTINTILALRHILRGTQFFPTSSIHRTTTCNLLEKLRKTEKFPS